MTGQTSFDSHGIGKASRNDRQTDDDDHHHNQRDASLAFRLCDNGFHGCRTVLSVERESIDRVFGARRREGRACGI